MIVVGIFANPVHTFTSGFGILLEALHQVVVGGPHILEGRIDQRVRFAKIHFQAIILGGTCQRFVKGGFERYPYPLSFSQRDVPQTISQAGGIPHRPGRRVKRPIFRTLIDDPPPEQMVQDPVVMRLKMTPVNLIQPSQGYQRLMEKLVIQGQPS